MVVVFWAHDPSKPRQPSASGSRLLVARARKRSGHQAAMQLATFRLCGLICGAERMRYETRLIWVLGITFGFVFFDRNAVNYLMPFIVSVLKFNNQQVGMIA